MRCEDAALLLSARLDGELSEAEERELNDHLAQCPACRALAEDLASLHASLSYLEDEPAPEGFAARVMERVRAETSEKKTIPLFKRPQVRAIAGLAACAVLCVGLYAASQSRKWSALEENFQPAVRAVAQDSTQEEGAVQDQTELTAAVPEALMETEDQEAPDGGVMYSAVDADGEAISTPSSQDAAAYTTGQSNLKRADDLSAGAVLTLSAFPQGGAELLSPETPVSYTLADRMERYRVTREEFEALAELAEEQGLVVARDDGDGSAWTVEVLPS